MLKGWSWPAGRWLRQHIDGSIIFGAMTVWMGIGTIMALITSPADNGPHVGSLSWWFLISAWAPWGILLAICLAVAAFLLVMQIPNILKMLGKVLLALVPRKDFNHG